MNANVDRRDPRCHGEAGESLAELLVTIAILGIAVVTIVASMAAAIALSTRHRQQASAATALVHAAESIKDNTANPYVACPATYTAAAGPSGYAVTATPVQYWDGSAFVSSCPGTDLKIQKVTVTVVAPGGYKTNVDVVKRNPN
jgi:type II secretory pathway pseudopilin PulG